MHHSTEITIWSDGIRWTAKLNNGELLTADEMDVLEEKIRHSCHSVFNTASGDSVTVKMLFDHSVIPEWIRQYSDHYFNRIVEFKY